MLLLAIVADAVLCVFACYACCIEVHKHYTVAAEGCVAYMQYDFDTTTVALLLLLLLPLLCIEAALCCHVCVEFLCVHSIMFLQIHAPMHEQQPAETTYILINLRGILLQYTVLEYSQRT
jgi:hypothetical protein